MGYRRRRDYSTEFKREAVELATQPVRSVASVAADLGIPVRSLGRWKRELQQHGNKAFIGQGVARDAEVMALHRELATAKKERLKAEIATMHDESDGIYGSPKVRDELLDEHGIVCSMSGQQLHWLIHRVCDQPLTCSVFVSTSLAQRGNP